MENDFFAVYLELPEDNWKFLIDSETSGKGYTGKLWINERDGKDATMLQEFVNSPTASILIEHYYRGYQFDYRSPFRFLLAQSFNWHGLIMVKDRISQQRFNRRKLIRAERLELLRYLVEETIQRPGAKFDPITLGMRLHSRRWFYHPNREEHQSHLRLLLQSLQKTGDLEKQDTAWVVSAQALATLSERESEEEKHQDNLNTARVGHQISRAVLLVGVLAIVVRFWTWFMEHSG